jgi:hypothetical protein
MEGGAVGHNFEMDPSRDHSSLPKLCPLIPTSNQDGHQAQNRKRGDEILIVHCFFSVSQNELKF